MTAPVDPLAIAFAVSGVLESLRIAHTIGGSLASSFAGEPRSTVDIDFVAAFDESHVPALVSALEPDWRARLHRRKRVVLKTPAAVVIREERESA